MPAENQIFAFFMTHLNKNIQSLIDDFAFLDGWEERYGYIIDLGKSLPEFPDTARTADNKVKGCVSQVWLTSRYDPHSGILTFRADSDAFIVKGLVAVVLQIYTGLTAEEIIALDIKSVLQELELADNLSPQRANGLRAMIARINAEAKAAAGDLNALGDSSL